MVATTTKITFKFLLEYVLQKNNLNDYTEPDKFEEISSALFNRIAATEKLRKDVTEDHVKSVFSTAVDVEVLRKITGLSNTIRQDISQFKMVTDVFICSISSITKDFVVEGKH